MSMPHRHKINASLLLICVKSSGQCSKTTRALDYASTELHLSNIAIAQIKFALHKHSPTQRIVTNFKIWTQIFTNSETLSHEFSIYVIKHCHSLPRFIVHSATKMERQQMYAIIIINGESSTRAPDRTSALHSVVHATDIFCTICFQPNLSNSSCCAFGRLPVFGVAFVHAACLTWLNCR